MLRTLARLSCFAILGCLAMSLGLGARQAAAADEGFRSIFDGKTLDGWDGDPRFWRVEDGLIVGQTTKEVPAPHNTFLIWRGGKPADFEIKAEFRMPDPGFANSGIQIRSWEGPQKWRVFGYQPDMDATHTYTGFCYGEGFRGILAQRGQKVLIDKDGKHKVVEQFGTAADLLKFIKKADWNEYDITAEGNRITEKVNGQLMCELTDEDKVARRDGIIALQLHAGKPMKVQFRNIRIKESKVKTSATNRAAKFILVASESAVSVKKPADGAKKIVFIAGKQSHGYAQHEHYAGCRLLADCIQQNVPGVTTVVSKGWPSDETLDGAATIVIYSDGGGGHPAIPHLADLEKRMHDGVGLACIHYAVEMPTGRDGDLWKSWIGGYFETFWSVNPTWLGQYKTFPSHPVANGVKAFNITDEWYYHMRFVDEMKGVTPILTAVPPDSTRRPGNDAHGANPHVFARKGMPEDVAWAYQRPDGGRGFGFTGGHYHWNWGCDAFRTVALNGIVWTAHIEVPAQGVPSKTPTFEQLEANQDKQPPKNFDAQAIRKMLDEVNKPVASK